MAWRSCKALQVNKSFIPFIIEAAHEQLPIADLKRMM
jgi:hypothetical protein